VTPKQHRGVSPWAPLYPQEIPDGEALDSLPEVRALAPAPPVEEAQRPYRALALAVISQAGSVTKRFLGLPVQSTYECKTRGEEKWHYPPRGEADAQTRKLCHAKMRSRAPSKPCLRATFL
jgi:hypothetical protein